MSVTINTGASWSSELCLEAFSSVYFSYFLVQVIILSFSGTRKRKRFFYLSGKLHFPSKQGETSCPLRKRLEVVFDFADGDKSFESMIKRSM